MYENGRQLNKHAAMKIHKENLKKKHTPLRYNSYEDFIEDNKEYVSDSRWIAAWWKPGFRKFGSYDLKKDTNSKRRSFYKIVCDNIKSAVDTDDIENCRNEKFSDRWYFDW